MLPAGWAPPLGLVISLGNIWRFRTILQSGPTQLYLPESHVFRYCRMVPSCRRAKAR